MAGASHLVRHLLALPLVALLLACYQGSPAPASGRPGASASSPRLPAASPEVSLDVSLPAFACQPASGGGAGRANVTAVRAASQAGFDRFVIQFDAPAPGYSVTPQASSHFVEGASGRAVTLSGSAGALVVVHGATGAQTYHGATDLAPGGPVLLEARRLEDFEGTVRWGLGLAQPSCLRVFTLSGPDRLVVDLTGL